MNVNEHYPAHPKTPRWFRDIVVTEKIDGTSGQIEVQACLPEEAVVPGFQGVIGAGKDGQPGAFRVRAGSRTRWITPASDNHGFARWVWERAASLVLLGPGLHTGEWWGRGIQRGYGQFEKFFSLFDVRKQGLVDELQIHGLRVVPTLYSGDQVMPNGVPAVRECLRRLQFGGSVAVPGWRDPEGVIVFHTAAQRYFKATLDGDEAKGN